MTDNDRRLIEDYLPIEAISAEASREKSIRKGHISTLHIWWARRPLVACRAAVYGALVPASQFVPNGASDNKKSSLGRANAAKFIERLCQYPGSPTVLTEARRHILDAHADRLTAETGHKVLADDIVQGRAPRPKVLDLFAGGGAIPLEALRLGCDAHAVDLNPVAHIIELCTLVYPQRFGSPDPSAPGMTGPKNSYGLTTWGGLAKEVRYWGNWVLQQVQAEVGDLYPPIPDPAFHGERTGAKQTFWPSSPHFPLEIPAGHLMPVAYLWTRTVTCPNPKCGCSVPLVKQTWLTKKDGRFAALKITPPPGAQEVRFDLVTAPTKTALGFDPEEGSYRGTAVCRFCGAVAENTYVMEEGCAGRIGAQLMAVVATADGRSGKTYLTPGQYPDLANHAVPDATCHSTWGKRDLSALSVEIPSDRRESFWCRRYGITRFDQVFTARQKLLLSSFSYWAANIHPDNTDSDRVLALKCYVTLVLGKLSDYNSSLCHWDNSCSAVKATFARQALPMVWDYPEINPFAGVLADAISILSSIGDVIDAQASSGLPATVTRSSATTLPYPDGSLDAVITDPPYYDNISYSKLADYFYVWFKQGLHVDFPEHFASAATPKKQEAVVDFARANGDRDVARRDYETLMLASFKEAHRVLKDGGQFVCVYAHKTTLGWASLVETLRAAGFEIHEAWPLDTEMKTRVRAIDSASLATSIFLVARKRSSLATGQFDTDVREQLEQTVRERVSTLWELGLSGADLVIACVGAGLRAFTRFARVEFANGEEVPAERFLAEVETAVLDSVLARLSKEVGGNGGKYSLAGLDAPTRFYVLWRYTYKTADLDAGEAIIFANGTHVELDGAHGLSAGSHALVAKDKSKYRLLGYAERGSDEKLGLETEGGRPPALVDVLHRLLWLMERRPASVPQFLREAQPNQEQLRLVAQALAGPALRGSDLSDLSPSGEFAALGKLTTNWRAVVEDATPAAAERQDKRTGQTRLDFGGGKR